MTTTETTTTTAAPAPEQPTTTATSAPEPTTAQAQRQRPDTIYNPGESVTNGDLSIIVDSIEYATSIPVQVKGSTEATDEAAAPGSKFLLVHSRAETAGDSGWLMPCMSIRASVYTEDMAETPSINRDKTMGGDLRCPMAIDPGTGFGGQDITWVFELPEDFDISGALFSFMPSACGGNCSVEPRFVSIENA